MHISRPSAGTTYILFNCLYLLSGILYPASSIISKVIVVVVIVWSMILGIKCLFLKYGTNSTISTISVFVGLAIVYGVLRIINNESIYITEGDYYVQVIPTLYLKGVLMSILPLYGIYYYSLKQQITEDKIRLTFALLLVITTILYFEKENAILASITNSVDGITNNVGYDFVALIPIVIFFRQKPILQYLILIFCFLFIVMSAKRGAIIIGGVCIIYSLIQLYNTANKKTKRLISIFNALVLVGGVLYFNYMLETNQYFAYRFEQTLEGNTSNRDIIYSMLYNYYFSQSNIIHLLFGNGIDSTISIATNYAHNDWLELLINQGLVGALAYLAIYISLVKKYYAVAKYNKAHAYALACICIFLFAKSLISMGYTSIGLPVALPLGYILASHTKTQGLFIRQYFNNSH